MNKLFTKIAALALGATMAVGVGVAVGSSKEVAPAEAADATTKYVLINSTSDLEAGKSYIITSGTSGTVQAMAVTSNTNNRKQTSATISNGKITRGSSILSLTLGGSTGAWTFYTENYAGTAGYLSNANSGTSNNLLVGNTAREFTISFNSDAAVITATSGSARNLMRYNSGSSCFACYGSGQNPIYLWKEEASKTLSSIAITTPPTKTTYYVGDSFDPAGMVVTATYSGGSTEEVTSSCTFSPATFSSTGSQNVTISYTEGGVTKTATQNVTVNPARTLSSIAVTTPPTKTTYSDGDSFDPAGMVVTATFSDSSTEDVTSHCTFSPDPLTTGTTDVTITYGGQTTTQAVTVNAVTEVTFTYGTDNSATSILSKSGVTMTIGTPGTDGTWDINNNNAYKVYKNKTLEVSGGSKKIDRIEFTGVSSYAVSGFTSWTTGTLNTSGNDGSWTGSSTSVIFTAGGAQVRMTEIYVHFETTEKSVELDHYTLDLKTTQTAGLTVEATVHNVDNPTYSWAANNNNVTLEDDDTATVTIKPNTNVAASSTVTLTVGGTTPNLTATVAVTISIPEPGETPETAFTVAQARAHIDEVVAGGESSGNDGNYYYAAGTVSEIVTPYDSTYHNISYNISADGTTSGLQLEAYRGKGLNGADFTSEDDLVVGDQVIIYGQLKIYNSTYEFDAGNYLYSQIPAPKVNSITLTPSIVEVAPEATGDITDLFTSIVINQDQGSSKTVNDIVWSTGDENVFYVDGGEYLVAGEHKNSTTLYASIGGKVYGSATIEVVDPDHPFITYDEPISWSLASSLSVGDRVAIVYENGDTLVQLTGVSSNIGQIESYETAGNPNSSHVYTVGAGNAENSFTFSDGTSYLAYTLSATSGSNNLHTVTNPTGEDQLNQVSWTVEINDGSATVTNVYNTVRLLRYNTGSPRFACYTGGQQPVKFYKLTGGDVGTIDLDNTILTLVQSKMSNYQDEHGVTQYGLSICNYNGGSDLSGWSTTVANGFTDSIISTYKLAYARSNRTGNDVEKFLSAYDYVVENYGASYDFLGRIASGKIVPSGGRVNPINTIISGESTTAITIVVIVSLVSLTAIGGYFFIKRRKEN